MDGRRLRGQSGEIFRVTLWHASKRKEIFVYGKGDDSNSSLPIGIIPSKYYGIILPYINYEDETVSYLASFDKCNRKLTIELSYCSLEDIQEQKRIQEVKHEENEKRLQSEYASKLLRPYKLKKGLEQSFLLGTSNQLKGKRRLENISIALLEKQDYLSKRKFNKVIFLENGNILGAFSADLRVIRALFSGQKLLIKNHKIERERNFGETYTTVYFTVSPEN